VSKNEDLNLPSVRRLSHPPSLPPSLPPYLQGIAPQSFSLGVGLEHPPGPRREGGREGGREGREGRSEYVRFE